MSRGWDAFGIYLAVALPLFVLFAWAMLSGPPFIYSLNNDFWEHSAVIREWMRDLWAPKNPHLHSDVGTPRYTPYYFLLALFGRAFGLNAIAVLTISAFLNISIMAIGVFLFFRAYFDNRFAPALGLIVLLTCWGTGWTWSSVYQLRSLIYVGPYPSTFAFAMTFWCLWLQLLILRDKSLVAWRLAALATMIAVVFASHPFNGAFAIGSLLLLAMVHENVETRTRLGVAATIVLGVCLSALWPYYSVFEVTLGLSGGDAGNWTDPLQLSWLDRADHLLAHPFYNPETLPYALGPAVLGFLCVGAMAWQRVQWFIVLGALIMLAPYIVNIFARIPLGHRFLIFVVFYLHLAMVWVALAPFGRPNTGARARGMPAFKAALLGSLGFAIAVGAIFNTSYAFVDARNRVEAGSPISETIGKIVRVVPRDSVVLARHMLAWPVPTFGGKVVSLFHNNPMVADAKKRERDIDRFFDPNAPTEDRTAILRKYNVDFALIDVADTPPGVRDFLLSVGFLKDRLGDLELYELRTSVEASP